MTSTFGYPNLEAACGGKLNPDTLRQFQRTMGEQKHSAVLEYNKFMAGLEALLAPRDPIFDHQAKKFT